MEIPSHLKKSSVPSCPYSINTVASFCGVLPATLRSWQRYGLITPYHDERGVRWYSENDLARLHRIVRKIMAGIPIAMIAPILNSADIHPVFVEKVQRRNSSWRSLQAEILACLGNGELSKLRQRLWLFAREYPLDCLVNQVLRPIRAFLGTGSQAVLGQQKGLLDSIIIEYATYAMRTARHQKGAQVLLLPLQIDDPLELWLEAIKLSGEGLSVEIASLEVQSPDLSALKMEHYLIWSDRPLDSGQQVRFDQWLDQGLSVMLIGNTVNPEAAYKYQNGDS